MREEIFLPSLPHWEFGNFWSGSRGKARFYITVTEGPDGKQMKTELWDQDVCRELADVIETRTFPCTREGLDEMKAYLEESTSAYA